MGFTRVCEIGTCGLNKGVWAKSLEIVTGKGREYDWIPAWRHILRPFLTALSAFLRYISRENIHFLIAA